MSDPKVEQCESSGQGYAAGTGPVFTALRRGEEGLRFLTREELAEVLQISILIVDAVVAAEEIPCVRLRGAFVRFYRPDIGSKG